MSNEPEIWGKNRPLPDLLLSLTRLIYIVFFISQFLVLSHVWKDTNVCTLLWSRSILFSGPGGYFVVIQRVRCYPLVYLFLYSLRCYQIVLICLLFKESSVHLLSFCDSDNNIYLAIQFLAKHWCIIAVT